MSTVQRDVPDVTDGRDARADADRGLDVTARLQLPAQLTAAARARAFIRDFCRASALPEQVCQTAALLVSELVTNAVVHGRSAATLEIHPPADTLRVSVHDHSPAMPAVGERPPLSAESGRGLVIVSMLAARWGVEATLDGKAIWFELPIS